MANRAGRMSKVADGSSNMVALSSLVGGRGRKATGGGPTVALREYQGGGKPYWTLKIPVAICRKAKLRKGTRVDPMVATNFKTMVLTATNGATGVKGWKVTGNRKSRYLMVGATAEMRAKVLPNGLKAKDLPAVVTPGKLVLTLA